MIFSCTKKVSDKLKKYKPIENSKEEIGLFNWYVDMLTLERKNYFLFTHSTTLFSFFIYAGTKKEFQNIETLFEQKLKAQIISIFGLQNAATLLKLFPQDHTHRFVKTNSRSVLGSMNDFKYQIKARVDYPGALDAYYDALNEKINEMPMGSPNYDSPKKRMELELNTDARNILN